ncbi:MAG TPA: hypothetical protein VGJ94_04340 [Syntrophorhabdaceae bacterium]
MNTRAKGILFMILTGFAMVGCSTTSERIILQSQSVRTDIFREADGLTAPAPGDGDLVVKVSIKTHSGEHPLWWIKDGHGSPGYDIVFNVDGQAVIWEVDPRDDVVPKTGKLSEDPEAGSGVKYVVEKRLRLKKGEKSIFLGLPEETCCTHLRIGVEEGTRNVLEFKPVYRKSGTRHIRNFMYGIDRMEVFFNGNQIQ